MLEGDEASLGMAERGSGVQVGADSTTRERRIRRHAQSTCSDCFKRFAHSWT